jgi:hypothetical protein
MGLVKIDMIDPAHTIAETLIDARSGGGAARGWRHQEMVGDKGYHSNQSLVDPKAVGVRSYLSEADRGRSNGGVRKPGFATVK